MFPRLSLSLPLTTVRSLLDYHALTDSACDPADLAAQAIEDWLQRQEQAQAVPAQGPGYRWKTLFLPEGTRLRVSGAHSTRYGEVKGDAILCNGLPTSPNRL